MNCVLALPWIGTIRTSTSVIERSNPDIVIATPSRVFRRGSTIDQVRIRWVGVTLVVRLARSNHPVDICGRSEEHTSELQSLMRISYAAFCLKKKKNTQQ